MRIQHNINALNAHRQLGINNSATGKNLEKLSSGFRINRAGDDAAGLAISEKMRGQIRGLDMATSNAQDGISLIQTAEGNLQETHSILQRMRELAVQSSNGTFEDANDRINIDKEVQALKKEINRIANSAHFNNQKLLDGTLAGAAGAGNAVASKIDATTTDGVVGNLGVKAEFTVTGGTAGTAIAIGGVTGNVGAVTGTAIAAGEYTVNGTATVLSNMFDITTTNAGGLAATFSTGDVLTFTAKVAGVQAAAVVTGLTAAAAGGTGGAGVNTVVGANAEASSAAVKAKYDIQLNFGNLQAGQKILINGKTIEFVTDVASDDATGKVNIADMSSNGAKDDVRTALVAALNHVNGLGAAGASKATAVAGAITGDGKITITADTGGLAGNLGAIRSSNTNMFVSNSQVTFGADAGPAKSTKFATATLDIDFAALAAGDKITINGRTLEAIAAGETADPSKNQFALDAAPNTTATNFIAALEESGFTSGKATHVAGESKITLTATDATLTSAAFVTTLGAVTFTPKTAAAGAAGGVTFQIGANGTADDRVSLQIAGQDTVTLGIDGIDVTLQPNANAAIDLLTAATNTVSGTRADLGALQNRLEHTVANLGTTSENLTAAESRIRDVDMAKEMMEMTKNNILSQAAQAMLAQANQQPQGILQLLR